MAELDSLFKKAIDSNASDIHLSPGEPYIIRQLGRLQKIGDNPLSPERCTELILEILDAEQKEKLSQDFQIDFAYEINPDIAVEGRIGLQKKRKTNKYAPFR